MKPVAPGELGHNLSFFCYCASCIAPLCNKSLDLLSLVCKKINDGIDTEVPERALVAI